MNAPLYLIGKRFGRLTVIASASSTREPSGIARRRWECRCECGSTILVRTSDLTGGHTQSCGAHWRYNGASRGHGMSLSPTWNTWEGMLKRCYRPSNASYRRYGARGITVCERWRQFENFFADMGVRPEGKELDRIDTNGNYEPGNCRWVTRAENSRNRCDTRMISALGKTQCLTDWARELGIHVSSLSARLDRGWSPERAVTVPPRRH